MNYVLICEGSTDYVLLQYYMREACGWTDDITKQNKIIKVPGQKSRNLIKDGNILTIMSVGGCSRLCEGLENVLKRNKNSAPDLIDSYKKIVIVTDRDEFETEKGFINHVEIILANYKVMHDEAIINNKWVTCEMMNSMGKKIAFSLLVMIVPFEENGAMETFLLNAISENDKYDEKIIGECRNFVDNIDSERRYLKGRRLVTKAKFDTYFSIRTPSEQFVERQNILKNIKWEQYSKIQKDFELLDDL